ncbi:phosphocholine cytidylyltransferase family protein [Gammaproteobacteria bacterium AB-CW1]|uniref:Phosphocholine cytidylyltransferase family protein n=1 Tax=Natronospira elongata TaxID=3110268 RepID=A0AAP6JFT5_9GAMM|nr:phosphocholine cytidylyltransferase family protein [Gammaproteobacteria bacterium AB-CW1]
MKAIILAAGQGTRLRPYTNDRPKCMVPLAGKPMLHRQLEVLRRGGVEEITLVGGYKADKLEASDVSVVTNPRYDRTNMVATLFCAAEAMQPGEDLLISYGDIVFEDRVLKAVLGCEGEICLGADREWRRLWETRMDDPLSDAETFKMEGGNRVVELGKEPQSYADAEAQYMGLIRIRGDRVADFKAAYETMDRNAEYDGKDFDNMYMTSFIQHLIDAGWDARAALVENGWVEVDSVEDLETFEGLNDEGELERLCRLD